MNHLQRLRTPRDYCVTLNLTDRIDPARVLRTISYAHPVFTPEGIAAQARHAEISGVRRTRYCGAYWRWGFHEDGVWSALQAIRGLAGEGSRHRRPRAARGARRMSAVARHSFLYEGSVTHRRRTPVDHAFSYPVCMLYLDLDELPRVLAQHPLWSWTRPAPGRIRRADLIGDPAVLGERCRARRGRSGRRVSAPRVRSGSSRRRAPTGTPSTR